MDNIVETINLLEQINVIVFDAVNARISKGENIFSAYRNVIDEMEAKFKEYIKVP